MRKAIGHTESISLAIAMYRLGFNHGYQEAKAPWRSRRRPAVKSTEKALIRAIARFAKTNTVTVVDVEQALGISDHHRTDEKGGAP